MSEVSMFMNLKNWFFQLWLYFTKWLGNFNFRKTQDTFKQEKRQYLPHRLEGTAVSLPSLKSTLVLSTKYLVVYLSKLTMDKCLAMIGSW